MSEPTIRFVRGDESADVPRRAAEHMVTMVNLLHDLGDDAQIEVPAPNYPLAILGKVVEFILHYVDLGAFKDKTDKPSEPKASAETLQPIGAPAQVPAPGANSKIVLPPYKLTEWDQWFFGQMSHSLVFDVLRVADDVDCRMCVLAAAQFIASVVDDKPRKQIEELYDLEPGYTAEDEERLYRQLAQLN